MYYLVTSCCLYNNYIEEEFYVMIQKACRLYFTKVVPRRSYTRTFFKNRVNKEKLSGIIEYLRNVPQHEQRTREWYEDRWNMISTLIYLPFEKELEIVLAKDKSVNNK